ncbi:MAG TPA: oligosaccharide biosynthesis protein Alg14 [Leucothrix mucor]|uniref:Oligosaccharide biosynthesis protein Alg14 n=1 Tax=Leucothrix mucor TaxID=45248 RepID=A0A7V2WV80_LEUMU|nr:oligosaccharide biosynthesis protein Alg14 [Leucothrix mucor]
MSKKIKILAISSPGGHWIQLNKICNQLEGQFDVVYATPGAHYKSSAKEGGRKIYTITDASADSKLNLIPVTLQILSILIRERPNTIISTGAAPGVMAILLCKFLPIKTIWVDSIANVKVLSRSGKMVKNHADLVVTQWQELSDNKNIFYRGSVL